MHTHDCQPTSTMRRIHYIVEEMFLQSKFQDRQVSHLKGATLQSLCMSRQFEEHFSTCLARWLRIDFKSQKDRAIFPKILFTVQNDEKCATIVVHTRSGIWLEILSAIATMIGQDGRDVWR